MSNDSTSMSSNSIAGVAAIMLVLDNNYSRM